MIPLSDALERIYRQYRQELFTCALAVTRCPERAEDAIHDALTRVPYGEGEVILSTLNLLPELTAERPQAAVAKKLFLNMLEYAREKKK